MSEGVTGFVMGLWVGILIFVVGSVVFQEHTSNYKHGQIDAINGKILFELKQQPDGTTAWTRK